VGVEEGYLPHLNSRDNPKAIEEERRLLYVGITRARQAVCLLHAATRFLWDGVQTRLPSRFLRELPENETEQVNLAGNPRRWSRW
jgi:DNA helicase-2/ATP-dependent DNA helicase PcrA